MSLLTGKYQLSATLTQSPARVVVLRDNRAGGSQGMLVNHLSALADLELHIVDLAQSKVDVTDSASIVLPSNEIGGRNEPSKAEQSRHAQSLWSKCGPGSMHDRVIRYSTRIGARLAIIQEEPSRDRRRWWRPSTAERLAFQVPVLSVPNAAESAFDFSRQFRWLVVLDGSPYAEAVLRPLGTIARWLPSDFTLAQPLNYAQLWRGRVAGDQPAAVTRLGVSIADSGDYLTRVAARQDGGCVRVLCVSDRNPEAALMRIMDSEAVDGVAIGVSRRSRFLRRLTGEFNELILGKLKKPYLLASAA